MAKKQESSSTLSDKRLETVLSTIEDGYYEVDLAGNLTFLNEQLADQIGFPVEELLGLNYRDYTPPETVNEVYQTFNKVYATGKSVKAFTWQIIRKDGTQCYIEASVSLMHNEQGEPIGFRGTARDITKRLVTEQMLAKRAIELEAVAQVSTAAATILDPQELLQTVVNLTKEHFNLYHAHIYLLDQEDKNLILTAGAGEVGQKMIAENRTIPLTREQSLVARAARTKSGVIVNNVQEDANFLSHPLLPDTRSEMAVPMIAGNELLGILDVQANKFDAFTQEDINIQTTLAAQVAVALQNARQHEQTQAALTETELLFRASRDLSKVTTVADSLEAISHIGIENGAANAALLAFDLDRKGEPEFAEVVAVWSRNDELTGMPVGTSIKLQDFPISRVWLSEANSPQLISDIATDPRIDEMTAARFQQGGIQTAAILPLNIAERWIGILIINWQDSYTFTERDYRIYSTLMRQYANIVDNTRQYELAQTRAVELEETTAALQTSEEKHRTILSTIQDGYYEVDLGGHYLFYNDAWCRILGVDDPSELMGVSYKEFADEEQIKRVYAKYNQIYKTGEPVDSFEYEIIRKNDGTRRTLDFSITPIIDETGEPTGFRGLARDVTGKRDTEKSLSKRANELETVAQLNSAAATILDLHELLQTMVNLVQERFNLYQAHIFLLDEEDQNLVLTAGTGEFGQKVGENFAIPIVEEQSLVARAARLGKSIIVNNVQEDVGFLSHPLLPDTLSEMVVPMLVNNDLLGVLDLQANMIDAFSQEDENIQSTLAAQVAVAVQNARWHEETKRQAAEVQQATAALQEESEAKYRTILETIEDGYYEVDLAGNYTFVNNAWCRLNGVDNPPEAMGVNYKEFMADDEAKFVYQHFNEVYTTGIPKDSFEYWLIRKNNGERRFVDISVSRVDNAAGEPIGFRGLMRDITARHNAEKALAKRANELETVAQVSSAAATILDSQELLQTFVDLTQERFGLYHAQIYMLNKKKGALYLAAAAGDIGQQMVAENWHFSLSKEGSPIVAAARSGEYVIVDNVHLAEEWVPNPFLPETVAEMGVPILSKGEVIGVLGVQANRVGGLEESDASLLMSLANNVAVSFTNAQLFAEIVQSKEEAERAREEAEKKGREAEIARQEAEAAKNMMEAQVWQTTGQAELSDKMRGEQDMPTLANNVIQQLCHYLNAQIGALYVVEDGFLNLIGTYAYSNDGESRQFRLGEGLIGQAALEKKVKLITNVPSNYITVRTGLGEAVPQHILVAPFLYEDQVIGVVEMGTLAEFDQAQLEFLTTAIDNIAIVFNTSQARARINELLYQTQAQAEELQVQGEELRVANEELEAQTESLRASEAKLKEKQIELEETNTQLEEKAAALEESSIALQEKQEVLDQQNKELKVAQEELEQKAEELARASKYKSEFLANMSHELRTPLNSLLILARLLVDNKEGNLTEEQVESAEIIYSGGNDLLNLINDILDLSKVESGKMVFNIEPIPLTYLTQQVRTQFVHLAESKGLALNITIADDLPPTIETDQQRLSQIIKNLLSNAFKFTVKGSVSLSLYRPDANKKLKHRDLEPMNTIAISVMDTGIGMTLDQQKIIFEAFQQADGSTSRQYGGTGLGLSISRELAEKLGGYIDVASQQGKGSTFTIYLPIENSGAVVDEAPEAVSHSVAQFTPQPVAAPKAPTQTLSTVVQQPELPDDRADIKAGDKVLLIVEDDPKFAQIVSDHSRKKGFKCLIAGNGTLALELVQRYEPSAIILDIYLPDISGWEILESIKNDPTKRHIPVHIISSDDEVLDAYHKGAMGYLTKPVSKEDLESSFQKIEKFISKEIKSLLVVEDDKNALHSIKLLLGGGDVHITEADHGQAALDLLATRQFDCIILDLSLPDMTGFEVLSKINEATIAAKCPIIIYTGRDLSPEENHELMKYADSVIVKGVKSPERLLDETSLFLHRVVSDMPQEKQQTIKQLYDQDQVLAGKKVLVVDDDMRNSFALSKLLSEKGLVVSMAANGQKALDLLATESVDLILMDIMMPIMDGYETIRQIRLRPELSTLPILALTAKAMKDDRQKCLAAGANDYLPKPVNVDRLFSMLQVWLYQ